MSDTEFNWHAPAAEWNGYELYRLPALGGNANYIYVVTAPDRRALVIDPGEAGPVIALTESLGLDVTDIWLTHHHWDHVDGLPGLREAYPSVIVTGSKADPLLPRLDRAVDAESNVDFQGLQAYALFTPGHTAQHLSYYIAEAGWVFSGDTIFSLGCGRLLGGTASQLFTSLARLSQLPPETLICAAHEYTQTNAAFALGRGFNSPAFRERVAEIRESRLRNVPTLPIRLSHESAFNPFLSAPTLHNFIEIREARDIFR